MKSFSLTIKSLGRCGGAVKLLTFVILLIGFLWSARADNDRTNRFYYDNNNRLIGGEYANGLVVAYVYDGNNNLVRQVYTSKQSDTNNLPLGWRLRFGLTGTNASTADGPADDPDGDGWSNYQEFIGGGNPTSAASIPRISIVQNVPGRIHMEQYNEGGEGAAYHDADAVNHGGYRENEGVDMYYDTATGEAVLGWTQAGEWINYSVNVQQEADYTLSVWMGSAGAAGISHIEIDGQNVSGPMQVFDTGSWSLFQPYRVPGVHLTSGQHILRIVMDSNSAITGGIGNFSAIDVVRSPPALQGLSVAATNSASVTFGIPQALSTNYAIGGYYAAGGITNTFAGTAPGPSSWEVGGLKAGTTYAFSFFAVDLIGGLSSPVVTTNVTTLAVPTPLQGISVWKVSPTNIIIWIRPPLSTNYWVSIKYVVNGVTNWTGTGVGAPSMGFESLLPNTTYAFTFYQGDIINNLYGPPITTNVTTLQIPGQSQAQKLVLKHRYGFGEPAGTLIAADSVGGANGTVRGGAAFSGNGTLTLNGTNGYVQLPGGIISSLSNATFEAWVTANSNASWTRVFDFGSTNVDGTAQDTLFLSGFSGVPAVHFAVRKWGGGESPVLDGTMCLPVGTRTHLVVTYDVGNLLATLYMNGLPVASGPITTPLSAIRDYDNWLGRSQFPVDPYFAATYDEFRIYDGILTPAESAASYALGPSSLPFPQVQATTANQKITLSWPGWAARYWLQSRASVAPGAAWTTETTTPVSDGSVVRVTFPLASQTRFYRLTQ